MSLEDIKGQERAVQYLRSALKNRRLPHAFLFVGPTGSGRRILAKTFAKAVNCLDRDDGPCGKCNSCRKIDEDIHPDVTWIAKDEKSNQVKIQSIRELEGGIALKPYEGRYKVYVVLDGECMNLEASNSFLKTLEEPPDHSIIIIIANSAHAMLPTVRSRCQVVRLKPLSRAALKTILTDEHHIPPEKADFISRYAEGKLGKALSEKDAITDNKNRYLDEFLKGEEGDIYTKEDRSELSSKLNILASWYRDLLIYKTTNDAELLINVDRMDMIKKESNRHSANRLICMLESVIKTKDMLEANVNPKLAISAMHNTMSSDKPC